MLKGSSTFLREGPIEPADEDDEVAGFLCESCNTLVVLEEGDDWERCLDLFLDEHAPHGEMQALARDEEPDCYHSIGTFRRSH